MQALCLTLHLTQKHYHHQYPSFCKDDLLFIPEAAVTIIAELLAQEASITGLDIVYHL